MSYPQLSQGDHIYVDLGKWVHHGIYCGSGRVIHFRHGKICTDSVRRFSYGHRIHVQPYQRCYFRKRVVARAKKRLGQEGYHFAFNNCEHFATWCKTGKSRSKQLEQLDKSVPKAVRYLGNRNLRKLSKMLSLLL